MSFCYNNNNRLKKMGMLKVCAEDDLNKECAEKKWVCSRHVLKKMGMLKVCAEENGHAQGMC